MTHRSKPVLRLALSAFLLLPLSQTAWAKVDLLGLRMPSSTGSYLAGREAFSDMRTADAASFYLDAAQQQWKNPEVVDGAFQALVADGRIDDAASLARHLLELDTKHPMARLVLGTVALKEGRYEDAAKMLEDAGSDTFIAITSSIVRAWALVGEDHYDEAQKVLGPFQQSGLGDFLAFHRALMADVAGRQDQAIDLAKQAYEADPNVARLVEAYVRMLGEASRFEDAQKVIDDFDDQGFDHPLVDALRPDIASKTKPGKLAPDSQAGAAEMFQSIGAALIQDGSNEAAIEFLRLGLYLDPKNNALQMSVAELLDKAGRHELANEIYKSVQPDAPMYEQARVRMAENANAMGDRKEAIRRLNNIIATSPDNLDALSSLGDMLRYDEQYLKAADTYTKALDLVGGEHPADWRFYYVRGISYERAGEWPKAEKDFLKALELNPQQPQVLNYLGYSWVDQGTHLQRALQMIKDAVSWDPSDGYVVDSLGWAYYKLGRIDEAVQTLEQAVQLRPDSAEVNDHLGDAYWRAGRKLEARFQWNIAADMDRDHTGISERVQQKLENGLQPEKN